MKTHLRSVPPKLHRSPATAFNTRGLEKLKVHISEFSLRSLAKEESASDEDTLTDRGTQTDDIHLPDPKNSHMPLKLPEAAKDPAPLQQFDRGTQTDDIHLPDPKNSDKRLKLPEAAKDAAPPQQFGPKLQLDAVRANTDRCHVTSVDQLLNVPPAVQLTHSGRLRKYQGTCASTPISLRPLPPSVTYAPHTPRYWETHSRVGVVGRDWKYFVLEVGVGEESQVDSDWSVCQQHRSWCVSVWKCITHPGSLCTRVWQQGWTGNCYRNTMSDAPGTWSDLHYGVVLDVRRGRLAFIDLDRQVVLAKVNVKWRESLLPVFGVALQQDCTVYMKVISGADINMTDTKKSLICDALN
ncbi:uncharacterized protein [Haliotis asinina]|uniref:uncharacterized protein n=1 Tax=Haliotis asinina TaxID=109174 RepID=UPI003531FFA0